VIRPVSTENASRGGASHPRPRLAADDTPLRPAARHCRRTSRWRSRRRGAPPVHDAGLAVGRVHEHVRERDKVQRTARPGGHLAVQAGSDSRPPGLWRSRHRHRARPPGRRPCGWRHRARTPASPPACSAGDHRVRGLPRDALAQGLVHQSTSPPERLNKGGQASHRRRRDPLEHRCLAATLSRCPGEAHDECPVTDRRYLSEASMAQLGLTRADHPAKPGHQEVR